SRTSGWGWFFFTTVPVGGIRFAMAVPWTSESHGRSSSRHLDIPGLASSAVMLFALTYALIEGHDKGWTSATILGSFALAAVAAAAFVVIERRSPPPLAEVSPFRPPLFRGRPAARVPA